MKLLTSPRLLPAIVLRRLFIAAANHRRIGKPESLGRSHGIRLDDGRSQPHSSPRWGWKADYCAMRGVRPALIPSLYARSGAQAVLGGAEAIRSTAPACRNHSTGMSNPSYSEFSSETRASDALTQLALDLYWTWNHSADEVWKRLDPELWELTGNPWLILQAVSQRKLDEITDSAFRGRVEELRDEVKRKQGGTAWFESAHSGSPLRTAAYFSMEYMLGEALPIYSGGLGNVAGDQLKAASDLGVPVVAVGLLYQQGYFRQELDAYGNQLALYPVNEPGQLPIRPLRTNGGEWLRIPFTLPGAKIWIRTWEVQVGRARLYLLDTNDPANLPQHRGITSELYGGGPEVRLKQELVLGVVGWRLLRALGIRPEVCHLNEGHAAFAVLERARSYMQDTGLSFEEALTITRAGNVFTTHTAVDAGFDRFAPDLIRQFLSPYAQHELRIPLADLLAMGRVNRGNDSEPFNMAYLAMRGSGSANGVSRLHGFVSRRLFGPLFPRFPEVEVPVGYVTNGIHVPTWDSAGADRLWTEQCGKGVWRGDLGSVTEKFRAVDDRRLWKMRSAGRRALVEYARERLARQEASYSGSPERVQEASAVLDSETLTLGFARRFATYKRPTLLLHDRERLARILTNPERPVQLVIAGKAHPQDEPGRALIREWTSFARQPKLRDHVVFLADYDMLLAERLVEGVDVWINTPRRPWEASGTSGMKVLVNGGLNLSVLDGWWAEAYRGELRLGDRRWTRARRRPGLGSRGCGGVIRGSGAADHPGVLRAGREWHPDRLGEPDLREYGDIDAGVFRESRGPAVHGRALHSRRERVRGARGRRMERPP